MFVNFLGGIKKRSVKECEKNSVIFGKIINLWFKFKRNNLNENICPESRVWRSCRCEKFEFWAEKSGGNRVLFSLHNWFGLMECEETTKWKCYRKK